MEQSNEPARKKELSEFAGAINDEQFAKAALEVRHHPSRYSSRKKGSYDSYGRKNNSCRF